MASIMIGNRIGKKMGIPLATWWTNRFISALTAKSITLTRIDLAWTNNGITDFDSIIVERSTDGITFTELVVLDKAAVSYSNTGLTTATQYYYYRLRYKKGTHYSSYSSIVVNYEPLGLFTTTNSKGWFNKSDTTTITKDESNLVSKWADKLGSGIDLVQTNNANKPLYQVAGGIKLQDTARFIKFTETNPEPLFVYALIKHTETDMFSGKRIWCGNTKNVGIMYFSGGYKMYNGAALTNANSLTGEWQIIRAYYNGTSATSQVDETDKLTGSCGGTNNFNGFTFGDPSGTESAPVEAAEFILRTDATDEQVIFDYLNKRKISIMISSFTEKYNAKTVSATNQLNVVMSGDSIFGRQYGTQISYSDNQAAGLFPPNMWQQIVANKVLKHMQYHDADIKYKNLSAWNKSAGWGMDKETVDNLRIWQTDTLNEYAETVITGASFFKLLYYTDSVAANQISITFNGVAPSALGLTGGDTINTPNGTSAGDFYKWANNVWSGLNPATAYTVRITNTGGGKSQIWGCESWSNERINVIVAAHGGYTANSHRIHPQNFVGAMYDPDLIIHELPCINDSYDNDTCLGSKLPGSAAVTATNGQFIWALETGTYTNYGGLVLNAGEYAEYNGSTWVKDSKWVTDILTYFDSSVVYLDTIKTNGIPAIFLIPHRTIVEPNRPWMTVMKNKLRLKLAALGYGYLDIDDLTFTDGMADGVHLNNTGVNYYFNQLKQVL